MMMTYIEQHITSVKCSQHSTDLHTRTLTHAQSYITSCTQFPFTLIEFQNENDRYSAWYLVKCLPNIYPLNSVHIPKKE